MAGGLERVERIELSTYSLDRGFRLVSWLLIAHRGEVEEANFGRRSADRAEGAALNVALA